MASIRTKQLANGQKAYQVRFRAPDGKERTKQFKRKRDAERHVHLVEIDRTQGNFVDPRLGRITVEEWFTRWWPTVTGLRPSTRARDEASFSRCAFASPQRPEPGAARSSRSGGWTSPEAG